jgi:UDP-N-acetyl-D-galactosamine dehydrogenase
MLRNKKSTIAIIGLGYVGLPLLQTLAKKNFKILGFDTNLKLIKDLKKI